MINDILKYWNINIDDITIIDVDIELYVESDAIFYNGIQLNYIRLGDLKILDSLNDILNFLKKLKIPFTIDLKIKNTHDLFSYWIAAKESWTTIYYIGDKYVVSEYKSKLDTYNLELIKVGNLINAT